MFKRSLRFCFLALLIVAMMSPAAAFAASPKPVQVFDVAAGKVVKTVENNEEYQNYAKSWLNSVTGLSPQLKPDEKCGHVYRIPLEQTVTVKTGKLTLQADDVFLFHCPNKPSVLLVFDSQKKPYLLSFKANLQSFLKKIDSPSV